MGRIRNQKVIVMVMAVGVMMLSAAEVLAASVDELRARATALVAQMTVDEKCAQLRNEAPAIPRLGIPAYDYWGEALHGVGRNGRATVFPEPIGMAASFDPELVHEVASAIADEGRVKYLASLAAGRGGKMNTGLNFWSPNVNIFRDPRWGRGIETWGEDPYLTGRMGVAFVRGIQGDDPVYLKAAACAKHYAVHSGPERERHTFDACPSKKDLRETYLPAFEACVREGRVEAVMGAYNRVYGESASASTLLLKDILRGEWGFNGHVVSDCEAVCDIWKNHKIVKTPPEAVALAIKNGLTIECGPCFKHLKKALELGLVTEKEVDALVERMLLCRLRLGILGDDPDCPYNKVDPSCLSSDAHHVLARKIARESMVLLKNDGVLPLDQKKGVYAVSGAAATDVFTQLGNYYGVSGRMRSYLDGIVSAVDAGVSVPYAHGFFYELERCSGAPWPHEENAAIVFLGLTPAHEGEEGAALLSHGNGDRETLKLPKEQLEHLRNVAKEREKGAKVIAVITGGSPVELDEVEKHADAIVMVWYSGEAGGDALADLLFGKEDFTGRLPVTFPTSADVLPDFRDYAMDGRTYKYQTEGVAYPFGFGLSYAKFACANLEAKAKGAGEVVTAQVKNEGGRDGTAVVQLYVSTPNAGKGAALKSLVGFRRVALKAGETKAVTFDVAPRQLMEFGEDGVARRVPGECRYSVQL